MTANVPAPRSSAFLKAATDRLELHGGALVRRRSGGGRRAGEAAGGLRPDGYMQVSVAGQSVLLHHVVWLLSRGEWPVCELDHIDGDITNNHPDNLRYANRSEQGSNSAKRRGNYTSEYKGVSREPSTGKWVARITKDKQVVRLGTFNDAELANLAYITAADRMFGQFACYTR